MSDSQTETTRSLYRKLAEIAGAITGVEKDGYNKDLSYRYARPETIFRVVKAHAAARNVCILPSLLRTERIPLDRTTAKGAQWMRTVVHISYIIADGDSGETVTLDWQGEGDDWSDKGIAKAQTIATRTFFIHLFQIPAGDEESDPDQSNGNGNGAHHAPPVPAGMTAQEAEKRFFARWGEAVGGATWDHVVAFMGYAGELAVKPGHVEDWKVVAQDVLNKTQAPVES
jgi:hypothetical protein